MATNRTVTVKASGGDYTTLSAAIVGEKGDLVSLDRQLTIECYSKQDTTAVTIADADWVTDVTRYILITTPTSERHQGQLDTTKYILQVSGATALTITVPFVRVDGLQIRETGNYHCIQLTDSSTSGADIRFSNNLLITSSSAQVKAVVYMSGGTATDRNYYFWNNSFTGAVYGSGNTCGLDVSKPVNVYVYNNSFVTNYKGIVRSDTYSSNVIAVNNIFSKRLITGYAACTGTFAAGTDYNSTDFSSMGYTVTGGGNTHDRVSQTFRFLGYHTDVYACGISTLDTGAKEYGVSDPGSGLFSTDIRGTTRTTWSIGAFEPPNPSTHTVTVKSSGGDYTTLSGAISGESKNLINLNRRLVIECYAKQDTSFVYMNQTQWTTDLDRSITITVPEGERHSGIYDTTKYRLEVGAAHPIQIGHGVFATIEWLQIYLTGAPGANFRVVYIGQSTARGSDIIIRNCIIRSNGTGSFSYQGLVHASYVGSNQSYIYVYNNMIYDGSGTNAYGFQCDIAGNYYVYNNTFYNVYGGLRFFNHTIAIWKNNLFNVNSETAASGTTLSAGTDYNRTNLSTLGYTVTGSGNTNDATSQTFTFVNPTASPIDLHLSTSDTGAKNLGVSDPGSGLFLNDIDGQTRTGSWDVGADEIVSSSSRRIFVD